ncbi:hypothetical protein D3C85_1292430 [compost metagenome]
MLHGVPGGAHVVARLHAGLALAVVAHARGLEDARQHVVRNLVDIGIVLDHPVRGRRHAGALGARGKELLLADAVLGDRHAIAARRHERAQLLQAVQRQRRHVLELGAHGLAKLAHLGQRGLIGIDRADMPVRHGAGRAVLIRVQHADAVAHGLRRMGEHAAELAAAEHAEPGTGQDRRGRVVHAELGARLRRVGFGQVGMDIGRHADRFRRLAYI